MLRPHALSRLVLVAAVLTLAVTLGARGDSEDSPKAADQHDEAMENTPVVVRLYDVYDLTMGTDYPYTLCVPPVTTTGARQLWRQPDYDPYSGGFFGSNSTRNEPPSDSTLAPETLEEMLRYAVDPLSWTYYGRIERFNTVLVITQSEANHRQIADLLAQLRSERPTVKIEARWVLLDVAEAAQLLPPTDVVPAVLEPDALAKVEEKIVYRGQITGLSQQTVHLAAGRTETLLTDVEPIVAESVTGICPSLEAFLSGAMLEVTAAVAPDGASATVDLRSVVSEMEKGSKRSVPAGGKGVPLTELDVPQFLLHTLRTTLRMPTGRAVVVGGLTSPMAKNGKVLYLVLEVGVAKETPATPAPHPRVDSVRTR